MTDPEIDLLRRLAGRVDDDVLRGLRGRLGAGETAMMADELVDHLADHGVGLTDAELALLDSFADLNPDERAAIPRADKISLDFTFDDGKDVPAPTEADTRLVHWLSRLPAARRLLRAYRRPVAGVATGQATWVYLVELDPEGEVAAAQAQLPIGAVTEGVGEVYTLGESLPPYHFEALRAARAVWSRHT